MIEDNKEFAKAKDYAYRLLSYRQRSIQETRDSLKKKGFSPEVISRVIEYLSRFNYLNDVEFARVWIQTKMQSHPLGWPVIHYQLRRRGVAEEILDKASRSYAGQYNEYELAKRLAECSRRQHHNIAPLKMKRRLYGYLRRRGFSQDAVLQAIRENNNQQES